MWQRRLNFQRCIVQLKYAQERMVHTSNLDADVRGFDEIPTPRGLPLIGTTLSIFWSGSAANLHKHVDKRHKSLGSIFKEAVGPLQCVFLSDPVQMRRVFAKEGKYPGHVLPGVWVEYNKNHGRTRGIFFMDGEEWLHFRKLLNPMLLKGDLSYIDNACEAAIEPIYDKIKKSAESNSEIQNLEELLYKSSLDNIVACLIGGDLYRKVKYDFEADVKRLASNVFGVLETSAKLWLFSPEFASKYGIPSYRRFEKTVSLALEVSGGLVNYLYKHYSNGDGLLRRMMDAGMELPMISRIVTDLIMAAGDTTAYTMEWMLYNVGKNLDVQKALRNEIFDSESKGVPAHDGEMVRNTLRESLRLYPTAPFLTRIPPESCVISGYEIPANTLIVMSIFTSGRDPNYVSDPEKFLPDRWIRGNDPDKRLSRLVSLPFAMGARSCIGRKIAEVQLRSTLAKIVKDFDITVCNRQEVEPIMKMVTVPNRPIRLKITKAVM